MAKPPEWIRQARDHWTYRGQSRPDFADEPGPGQESVWDYPRPPHLASDARVVAVRCGAVEVALSRRAVRVLETAGAPTFYIPPDDVRLDVLEGAPGSSLCEWKGEAVYWSLRSPEASLDQVGWSYPDPYPEFSSIAGWFSFYPARLECYVDGERAKPQPGGLYGGWVTSELAGPIKGGPGSQGW